MAALALHLIWMFSLTTALVLALRRPLRRWLGVGQTYALWMLVPVTCAAALLHAPWEGPVDLDAPVQAAGAFVLPTVHAYPAQTAFPWWTAGLVIWLSGVVVRAVTGSLRLVRVRQGLHRLPADAEAHWLRQMRAVKPGGRLPHPVHHPMGPALFGCVRPVLLLPPDIDTRFSPEQAELILRHELVHHRRGDGSWNLLAGLLATVFWWHPLTGFALRRFRLDQELACDRAVLAARPGQARAYGDALIDSHSGARIAAASHWFRKPQLKERIRMIGAKQPTIHCRRAGALLLSLGIAAVAVAAPRHALVPVQAVSDSAPASASPAAKIPPKAVRAVNKLLKPRYPASAVKGKQQGKVVVKARVDAHGHVTRTLLVGNTPVYPALAQSALDFVSQMSFRPATLHGKPVAAWVRVPVTYSLNDKK